MKHSSSPDLIHLSKSTPPTIDGKLDYKCGGGSSFSTRYFKLVKNLLFYYRLNEWGRVEEEGEPLGVVVLTNIALFKNDYRFGFTVQFNSDSSQEHLFTARSDEDVHKWMRLLGEGSHSHWSQKYREAQLKLEESRRDLIGLY